ncbi:hypothetical protein BDF21DRAFT_423988 [Thamnidium elegans]|nr:hypothetical protein BDF21DRAFT_423988 [Thamnidium elegans]
MSIASCFWALLSLENFEYIYLPDFITDTQIALGKTPADILLCQSLLQFIHPDEFALAKNDLMNFIRIKTLAGAVTRCRLKSIKSIIYQEYGHDRNTKEEWIITDVVMYTATNNTILTFFHSHELDNDNTTCCGSRQLLNEPSTLQNILQLNATTLEDPIRIFQLYYTQTKQLIISWPGCLDDTITQALKLATLLTEKEMDKRIQYPLLKTDTACTHHSHSNSHQMLEPFGLCQIERIIITYGSLTFSSFQFTPIIENSTSTYHHYMYMTPRNYQDFKRKSNINDILNNPQSPTSSASLSSLLNTTYSPAKKYSEPAEETKSPLPKAWRGRFGAYEKKCENCQTSTSPEWRKGPTGHKTLCNACGLRYARLIAKHERLQGPKEEEISLLKLKNNTTLKK